MDRKRMEREAEHNRAALEALEALEAHAVEAKGTMAVIVAHTNGLLKAAEERGEMEGHRFPCFASVLGRPSVRGLTPPVSK